MGDYILSNVVFNFVCKDVVEIYKYLVKPHNAWFVTVIGIFFNLRLAFFPLRLDGHNSGVGILPYSSLVTADYFKHDSFLMRV